MKRTLGGKYTIREIIGYISIRASQPHPPFFFDKADRS